MSAYQKNRVKKILDKVSPPIYKKLEDILTEIDLQENIESLSQEEIRYLEKLRNTPVDPDLVRIFNQLDTD
jgi:hypothetical protein